MRDAGEMIAGMLGRKDLLGIGEISYRDNEVWKYALDTARLVGAGWNPKTSLLEGLQRTIEWEGTIRV